MSWLTPEARTVMSYAQASALWSKVRSPEKGKPITGWLRMYKVDDNFEFRATGYGSTPLGTLTPDNKFTFTMSAEGVSRHAQTLVGSLYRWLPFSLMRHRKGLYRIAHTTPLLKALDPNSDSARYGFYSEYGPFMRQQPSYYGGIQFDMVSGECLNPRPDDKLIEIPEKRKEWRKALTQFKRGLKARVRVHAMDGIIDKMWSERNQSNRWDHRQPDWSSSMWIDKLEQAMRDNEFSQELLMGIVQTSHTGYYMQSKPTGADVLKAVDKICNDNSIELRRRFGVFKKEWQQELGDA